MLKSVSDSERTAGEMLAMFYEAWAMTLENRHKYELADKTLLLGQSRNAEPKSRLLEAHTRLLYAVAC
jgi:hypothetical protein